MTDNPFPFNGLSNDEVIKSRQEHGVNELSSDSKNMLWSSLLSIVSEPMFIILVISALIYYTLGEIPESLFMLAAIILISAISFYQESRSNNALMALRALTAPKAKVIRNGEVIEIPYRDVVVGDFLIAEEGTLLPADGLIAHSHDFSVDESILTGESFSVSRDTFENKVSKGTLAVSGLAVFKVTAVGNQTRLGKIGRSLKEIKKEKTPLQTQIETFVKQMAISGGLVFLLVWILNFLESDQFLDSLLKALTLAMSILPEEIPVAFTTFMALGAWRLMKKGVIVKEIRTVETLGSATVICTDKTGTITENRMQLAYIHVPGWSKALNPSEWENHPEACALIEYSMWASEPVPFDPMEKALHQAYVQVCKRDDRPLYRMVHEYPLEGKPPMMTHIFENNKGNRIIAAKGAPESILSLIGFNEEEKQNTLTILNDLLKQGYRVLAVARSEFREDQFPEKQQKLPFIFMGLVAFYDPPKANIKNVFRQFYEAGLDIKIITGDNALTTSTIARQSGLREAEHSMDGEMLVHMPEDELEERIKTTGIFTRMFPEAKLRIINALKKNGNIVAMTGDGVNDGPALKAAHIGIAMGKRGSEIARQSADLILMDDDLDKMLEAVAMGRRIYANLKKAIQYIISIHIPIILTVSVPLLLGWKFPNIFTPVHVIFLELIMGPTCSIAYENEPMEPNSMKQAPRPITKTFLSWKELSISIWQGLIIAAATLMVYQYAVRLNYEQNIVRTMVFVSLVTANIFLTLVNRSFYLSMFSTFRHNNWMLRGIIVISILMLVLLLKIEVFRAFFRFSPLTFNQISIALLAGFLSVIWFEVYKWKAAVPDTSFSGNPTKL